MLNKIIKSSLDNRLAVVVLTGLLLVAGVIVMMRMEVDIFPDLNAPTVAVMTEAPGMAPEEIETTVTYPVETAVNGASGVRRVRSATTTGFSVVWVEFDWNTDPYLARQIVAEKLSEIEGTLPPGTGSPTLGSQSSILGEMMIIGMTSADSTISLRELRTLAERQVRPRILSLGGVSQVSVIGGDAKEYQIRLCPAKMQRYGVTLNQVRESVSGMNRNVAGGVVYDYGNEYIVKGDLSTTDVNELATTVVGGDSGSPILLSDVAEIAEGGEEPRLGVASVRSEPAVLLTVSKQPGAGTIELTKKIDAELAALSKTFPAGVTLHTDIFRQADFIQNSISNLQESLFVGAIFVIVVLFFFLQNLRTTLISLVALPLSVLVTLIILYLLGFSINTMSLGGIAIAIGSLVDDAIVDVENVYKRLRERRESGESVLKIVFEASKEVRMPIFNSSLIIMASFIPLFFLHGMEGRMLKPLGISFIVSLVASTIVALTVTPVLCSYLLGSKKAMSQLNRQPWLARKLSSAYERGLRHALSKPRIWIGGTALLFIVAIGMFFTLGRSFLPPFNEGSLTINVSTLPGISLDRSDEVGREAEKIILSIPEIRTVARKTGRAELDEHSLGVNVSEIEAPYVLDKGRSRREMVAELREKLSHLPGANIEVGQPISHRIDAMLSGTEAQIAIKLFGPDLSVLNSMGNKIKELTKVVDGVVDANIEQLMERPQLDVRPRREMLAYYGIPMSEFADYIGVAMAGEVVSQVYEDGFPVNLTLRVEPDARNTIESINSLMIDSQKGKIPLSAVADVVSTSGPNAVNRENVSRRIVVSANVDGRDLRGVVEDIQREIEENVDLPAGYHVSYGGQFESEQAATRTLALVSVISIIIIFLLLYGQYHSWVSAAIIMLNMPLALIGGVFILRFTSGEMNIPAIIGFISLMGIATRNGMLLMSRYETLRHDGEGLLELIIHGSADRLTPILMTALSSALALIPLAVGGHLPGNEIQSPLAIVILGGLLSSTLLNIFIVPIICYIVSKKEIKEEK